MGQREEQSSWREILSVPSRDFYAIADMDLARQLGAALWLMGAVVAAVLFAFAPPDKSPIGGWGWIVAAGIVVASLTLAARLSRSPTTIGPRELLVNSVISLSMVGLLMWLADEPGSYGALLLFATIYVAGVHPPRLVLGFLVGLALALASPLLYYAGDSILAEQVARFLTWSFLALVATAFVARVRYQRAGLLRRGDEALIEAREDSLTVLGNRRAFDEALAAATVRADRTGTALSVVIVDLDSFKAINDSYGLVEGDRVLREVAATIAETVRSPDSCFRWGGDEFVVLADVDRAGADRLVVRLAEAVSSRCRRPDGSPILIHTGAAQLGVDSGDAGGLLAAAGAALKPAKSE